MKGTDCIHFIACARMNAAHGYTNEIDELCNVWECPLYLPQKCELNGQTLSEILLDAQLKFSGRVKAEPKDEKPAPARESHGVPFRPDERKKPECDPRPAHHHGVPFRPDEPKSSKINPELLRRLFTATMDEPKPAKPEVIPLPAPRQKELFTAELVKPEVKKTEETLLTAAQVALRFGINRHTVYNWAYSSRNEFPEPVYISPGRMRWRLSDIKEFESRRGK